MIEEVEKNIFRLGIPLPGNPLKELNSYFVRGGERDLLIDTGFRRRECREALEDCLAQLSSAADRRDVLVTHLHSDHSGMADLFAGKGRSIYMGRIDLAFEQGFYTGDYDARHRQRYVQEGFDGALVDEIRARNPARVMSMPTLPENIRPLDDGDVLRVGDYTLQAVLVPGHTPGNLMFWAEKQGIMFSGDHILFDITPNITAWATMEDALGSYLDSLEKAAAYPVRLALPGHRKSGGYHARIAALQEHHRARLAEALGIIRARPGLTAFEIAGYMTWRIRASSWETFPDVQKWFAVGECLSHLDHLRLRGRIQREMRNGVWRYTAAP